MCGFQARGQGFYYIHDSRSAKKVKDRSNNIVVSVTKGLVFSRRIEHDFNIYLGSGWRCTVIPIGLDTMLCGLLIPEKLRRHVEVKE